MILPFDFYTVFKILICCSLIKHFPNNNKRYSSHSQALILHTGSNKSLLKIYESPKNSYLKKGSIQGLSYMMTTALGLYLVYSFINFAIPLHSLTSTPFMSLYIAGRGVLAPYFMLPTSLFQISSKLLSFSCHLQSPLPLFFLLSFWKNNACKDDLQGQTFNKSRPLLSRNFILFVRKKWCGIQCF